MSGRSLPRSFSFKLLAVTSFILTAFFLYRRSLVTFVSLPLHSSIQRQELYQNITRSGNIGESLVRTSVGGKFNTVYDERKNTLLNACSLLNVHEHEQNSDGIVRDHFVVDRRNKILFCGMEKVGCTFWKRLFQITTGVKTEKNLFDIPAVSAHDGSLETLRNLKVDDVLEIVHSFTTLIFVREPYSRIFSGYIDKVFSPNPYYFKLRQDIANFSGTLNESICAPYISFGEFLPYVLNTLKTNIKRDGHYVPMYDHCRPCALQYGIIGKMETVKSDLEYLMESHNLRSIVEVNLTGQSREVDTIKDTYTVTYAIRAPIEKCMEFIIALKLIWRKFQIRGVIQKDIPFPSQYQNDHIPTCEEIISETVKASERSDPVKRKANKLEALKEAFKSVSTKDLAEYRDIFEADFKLFGYDIKPTSIFSDGNETPNFSFFKI